MIEGFKFKPSNYKERVGMIFSLISTDTDSTRKGIEMLRELINEVEYMKNRGIK